VRELRLRGERHAETLWRPFAAATASSTSAVVAGRVADDDQVIGLGVLDAQMQAPAVTPAARLSNGRRCAGDGPADLFLQH